MSYFSKNFFVNDFEFSNSAASFTGPNILRPFSSNKSEIPSHNGFSGPTTVKSISFFFANSSRPCKSSAWISTFSPILSVPAFPGAKKIFLFSSKDFILRPSANSLPPEPTTKIFIKPPNFNVWNVYFLWTPC